MKTENTIPIEGVQKSYFKNGQIKSSYIKIACKTVHIYSTLSKALAVYP